MPDYALINQFLYEGKAPKVEELTREALAEGSDVEEVLHEGLIGVFDDQLVEKDYDDIEDKKYSITAKNGWTGITDKFWTVVVVPENNKGFRSDFEFKINEFIQMMATSQASLENKAN